MPINVFPWPPVGAIGAEWTEDAPVARLRSALTGRDQMQASQRKRRIATVQVSALARGRSGGGYCEMLKQLLEGGIHGVRLKSSPINWHLDEAQRQGLDLNAGPLSWRTGSDPLAWRSGGEALLWYSGKVIRGGAATVFTLFTLLPVTGLPPNMLVARPGDFIQLYRVSDPGVTQIVRVVRPALTNSAGEVTLQLDRAPTISYPGISFAGQDEAVFRVDGPLPRAVQPVGGDWSYTWNFREVFADEVGGFTERTNTWT